MTTFEQFNLQNQSKSNRRFRFYNPTSIQEKLFCDNVWSWYDGIAQTGTGKTFAYLLPLLKLYKFIPGHTPKIVILVPTRELVVQVVEEVEN
jgi:ATP-dependent RNA helicase RhlE